MGTPMNFSVAIGNPPYSEKTGNGTSQTNISNQIIEKITSQVDDVITIAPVKMFQQPKKYRSSVGSFDEKVLNKMTGVQIIPQIEASRLFKNAVNSDLGIMTFQKGKKQINPQVFYEEKQNFYRIIDSFESTLVDHKEGSPGKYFVCVSPVHGNFGQNDFFEVLPKDRKKYAYVVKPKSANVTYFNFQTCSERENFFDSLHTEFIKFIHSLTKTGTTVRFANLPYMEDYTKPWTNERFYKYFKISKEEQKIIEDWAAKK